MISQRGREMRKGRSAKLTKNVERLYKEGKCRDCSVMITRMDFAKILGKFTKVKIQYESSATPKTKKSNDTTSNSTTRLKKSENGMVLIHRNAINQHPAESTNSKKPKNTKQKTVNNIPSPRPNINILKENNRLKRTPIIKDKNSNYNQQILDSNLKQYGIIFIDPSVNKNNDHSNKATLLELLPDINKTILPTDEWDIDYFPKSDEPKEDKVYDRIAAELEDLMYSEKTSTSEDKTNVSESKVDDFPSIMDILNESTPEINTKSNDQTSSLVFKPSLESSDVEAMLLGKSNITDKEPETVPMDVDNNDMANLIGEVPLDVIQNPDKIEANESKQELPSGDAPEDNCVRSLSSPSVLDEALQKGIEEQLPFDNQQKDGTSGDDENKSDVKEKINENNNVTAMESEVTVEESKTKCYSDSVVPRTEVITHVIFKQSKDGKCYRCVTCPKNLKYSIELDGKSVEFIGAPKFISSLEDLKVLLQIVNESHLESLYVLH